MSLLNRIAISNGNQLRKTAANLAIATIDHQKVVCWNQSLQGEICQKEKIKKQLKKRGQPIAYRFYNGGVIIW